MKAYSWPIAISISFWATVIVVNLALSFQTAMAGRGSAAPWWQKLFFGLHYAWWRRMARHGIRDGIFMPGYLALEILAALFVSFCLVHLVQSVFPKGWLIVYVALAPFVLGFLIPLRE